MGALAKRSTSSDVEIMTKGLDVLVSDPNRESIDSRIGGQYHGLNASMTLMMAIVTNAPGPGLGMVSTVFGASFVLNMASVYISVIPYRKYDVYGKAAMDKLGKKIGYDFLKVTPKNRKIARLINTSRRLADGEYYELPVSVITNDKNSPYTLILLSDQILLKTAGQQNSPAAPEISEGQWQRMYDSLEAKSESDEQ